MKYLFLLLFSISMLMESNAQQTINGVNLPAKLKTTTSELSYNGGGLRKKSFFKVYVLGLYLTEKSKDATSLLKSKQEMAARLQITSSVVTSDRMTEAILEGFEKSTNGNMTPLKAKIDDFILVFKKEPIKENDVFILDYVPNVGVKTFKNGKLLTTVAGDDFKEALFGIWIGSNPIDATLKKGLLGN